MGRGSCSPSLFAISVHSPSHLAQCARQKHELSFPIEIFTPGTGTLTVKSLSGFLLVCWKPYVKKSICYIYEPQKLTKNYWIIILHLLIARSINIMSNKIFLRLIIRSMYVIYLEQFVFAYQYYVKCSAARQFAAD